MASSSKPASGWPKVTLSSHQNRCCGPCFICGAWQPRYDHYCTLTNGEQRFFQLYYGSNIPTDGCMCQAHRREAQRHQSDPEYIPAWKKQASKGSTHNASHLQCSYTDCTTTSLTERVIVPSVETQAMFCEALGTQHPATLCETHYQYNQQVHTHNLCAGCRAKPKARQGAYMRHSPDSTTISQYSYEKTGFEVSLTPTDTLFTNKELWYTSVFATLNRQNEYHTVPYNMLYAGNTIILVSTLPVPGEPLINMNILFPC